MEIVIDALNFVKEKLLKLVNKVKELLGLKEPELVPEPKSYEELIEQTRLMFQIPDANTCSHDGCSCDLSSWGNDSPETEEGQMATTLVGILPLSKEPVQEKPKKKSKLKKKSKAKKPKKSPSKK